MFGGIQGIGAAIEADEKLRANKSEQIFSHICESAEYSDYGSRSIRLEVMDSYFSQIIRSNSLFIFNFLIIK